jgi:hypothetical protein
MKRYLVWCPEYDQGPEDGVSMDACNAYDAAEKWADRSDRQSADYAITRGDSVEVIVRFLSTGSQRTFRVHGESVPVYTATELKR